MKEVEVGGGGVNNQNKWRLDNNNKHHSYVKKQKKKKKIRWSFLTSISTVRLQILLHRYVFSTLNLSSTLANDKIVLMDHLYPSNANVIHISYCTDYGYGIGTEF